MNKKFGKILRLFCSVTVLLFAGCSFVDGPCLKGEGAVVREPLELDEFTGINLAMAGNVFIYQGEIQNIEIEAQPNVISRINRQISGGIWRVSPLECLAEHEQINIYITVPQINDLSLTGSGSITVVDVFDVAEADLMLSGSGNVEFRGTAENTSAILSGSGSVVLEGTTAFLDATLSGSGNIRAFDMTADQARVNVSGSGSVEVQFVDSLMAVISGSGNVYYLGDGSLINQDTPGSGRVEAAGN